MLIGLNEIIVSLLNHQIIIQIIGQLLTGDTDAFLFMNNKFFNNNSKLNNENGIIFQLGYNFFNYF